MSRQILQELTPGDRWVLGGLLLVALVGFWVNWRTLREPGQAVLVERDNYLLYKLPLDKAGQYTIPGAVGGLTLRIADGKVWVARSTCPHKICMRMGKISRPGQIIVCIPNHLIIRIAGKTAPSFDVITE